jgi:hypothetical protein
MEFYNKVLCELYEAVFDLNIAPLQFKNYVIEQRVSRWKIQKTIDLLKNSFENIFSDESKDGNAKNVRKFASEMTSFKTGDKAKALTAQDIIEKLLAKVNDVSCTISEKRSMLFNTANEVKPWKANELKFYDNKLDGLKSMKVKLEESHTTIITNCNLLTAGKFLPKVMQKKNAKENASVLKRIHGKQLLGKRNESLQERVMSQRLLQVAGSSTSLWKMVLKKSLK